MSPRVPVVFNDTQASGGVRLVEAPSLRRLGDQPEAGRRVDLELFDGLRDGGLLIGRRDSANATDQSGEGFKRQTPAAVHCLIGGSIPRLRQSFMTVLGLTK